jgi:hypothetical protein
VIPVEGTARARGRGGVSRPIRFHEPSRNHYNGNRQADLRSIALVAGEDRQMTSYDCGRIRVLAAKLAQAGVPKDTMDQILAGGETIQGRTTGEKKADWMRGAMSRMDALLDEETRHSVLEACACCLGGKRLDISRRIAKDHESLQDRIRAANEARFVFGHSVTAEDDGGILVSFAPEGLEHYRCVCLPKAKEPISITHCYCCGGHIRHHLQIALGRKVSCLVRSSALSSGGKSPCAFLFRIDEQQ